MKFTQSMRLHINGGKKFSELHYNVLCDGKECGIERVTRTKGSPKYILERDVFVSGTEEFDCLKEKGVGLQEWLESHAKIELQEE